MKIFLIRHGTRDFVMGDVPLNRVGLIQAQAIAEHPDLQNINTLLSSPKKRAQMTLEPLSKKLNLQIEILDDLDQMGSQENQKSFQNRVEKVVEQISQTQWSTPMVICSHSDWLSMALNMIPSDHSELNHMQFACAQVMHFEIKESLWHLLD